MADAVEKPDAGDGVVGGSESSPAAASATPPPRDAASTINFESHIEADASRTQQTIKELKHAVSELRTTMQSTADALRRGTHGAFLARVRDMLETLSTSVEASIRDQVTDATFYADEQHLMALRQQARLLDAQFERERNELLAAHALEMQQDKSTMEAAIAADLAAGVARITQERDKFEAKAQRLQDDIDRLMAVSSDGENRKPGVAVSTNPKVIAAEAKLEAAGAKMAAKEASARAEKALDDAAKLKDAWAADLKHVVKITTLVDMDTTLGGNDHAPADPKQKSAASNTQARASSSPSATRAGAAAEVVPVRHWSWNPLVVKKAAAATRNQLMIRLTKLASPGEQMRALVGDYEEEKARLEEERAEAHERIEQQAAEMSALRAAHAELLAAERAVRASDQVAAGVTASVLITEVSTCEGVHDEKRDAVEGEQRKYSQLEMQLHGIESEVHARANVQVERLQAVVGQHEATIEQLQSQIREMGEDEEKRGRLHLEELRHVNEDVEHVKAQLLSSVAELARSQSAGKHHGYFFSGGPAVTGGIPWGRYAAALASPFAMDGASLRDALTPGSRSELASPSRSPSPSSGHASGMIGGMTSCLSPGCTRSTPGGYGCVSSQMREVVERSPSRTRSSSPLSPSSSSPSRYQLSGGAKPPRAIGLESTSPSSPPSGSNMKPRSVSESESFRSGESTRRRPRRVSKQPEAKGGESPAMIRSANGSSRVLVTSPLATSPPARSSRARASIPAARV